jgi:hypothetical protein
MAGLVPAIHVLATEEKSVDARDKPGHDGVWEQPSYLVRSETVAGSRTCGSPAKGNR